MHLQDVHGPRSAPLRAPRLTVALAPLCVLGLLPACRSLPQDAVQHCTVDTDCPQGQLCASDATCWKPPELAGLLNDAPDGIRVQMDPRGSGWLLVSWNAVAGATGYELLHRPGPQSGQVSSLGLTKTTSLLIDPLKVSASSLLAVRATNAVKSSPDSGWVPVTFAVPPPEGLALTASSEAFGLVLSWRHALQGCSFAVTRNGVPAGETMALWLGQPTLEPGQNELTVRARCGASQSESAALLFDTTPAPPQELALAVTPVSGGVVVTWAPVDGTVWQTVNSGEGRSTLGVAGANHAAFLSGRTGELLHLRVLAWSAAAHVLAMGTADYHVPPAPPGYVQCVAAQDGGVRVTWPSSLGATSYEVSRKGLDGAWVVAGSTSGTSFSDAAAPAWTQVVYSVRALAGTVAGAAAESAVVITRGPPVPDNTGADGLASPVSTAEQRWTVQRSGVLEWVEVSATATSALGGAVVSVQAYGGGRLLGTAERLTWTCCVPDALGAATTLRLEFSSAIEVRAGEELVLVAKGPLLATTVSAYAPLQGLGVPDSGGRSLVFRTQIRPLDPADVSPQPQLYTQPDVGSVALAWAPLARATAYHVERNDGGAWTRIVTTQQPGAKDTTAPAGDTHEYRLVVEQGTLAAVTSATVQGTSLRGSVAASASGAQGVARVTGAAFTASQRIHIPRAGILRAVELATSSQSADVTNLTSGATLRVTASQGLQAPLGRLDPADLRQRVFVLGSFPPVAEGDDVRVTTFPPYDTLDTSDETASGTEDLDGNAVPARDLLFKLVLE